MALAPGTRLGAYEIQSLIGSGGMGEVYRARDPKLKRDIAIKVLAEKTATDPERRARFEREAQSIAALSHPNIVTVYSVEEAEGALFLTMEYVEGKPFTDLIVKAGLPLSQILNVAIPLADAVSAAHQRGITHRDLKPANVMVTADGRVKVLDFGLAKMMEASPVEVGATGLPTGVLTGEGLIVGTVAYMSPEQAEGKPVDHRSDIFSLGVLLYEMATGERPFKGDTSVSVLSSIIKDSPRPVSDLKPALPRELERMVKHCLVKDPEYRYQSAKDLRNELRALEQESNAAGNSVGSAAVPTRATPYREWTVWITAVLLVGLASFFAVRSATIAPPRDPISFAVFPPEGTVFASAIGNTVNVPSFSLSPDGHAMVFSAEAPGAGPMLWLRPMDQADARQLAGTENAQDPFWSFDSRWIGFFADGKLRKIPSGGGAVQVLTQTANDYRGATWGAQDTILLGIGLQPIVSVSAAGGPTTPVTNIDASREEGSHRFPYFLPDGDHFLYSILGTKPDQSGVYGGSLDGKTKKPLLRVNTSAVYAPPGYLLFVDGDTLLGQAFDAQRLELKGQPFLVAEHVGRSTAFLSAVSASRTGTIAYARPLRQNGRLVWIDRQGTLLDSPSAPEGDYTDFRLSPDGAHLAASLVDPKTNVVDIWMTDLTRGSSFRIASGGLVTAAAVWSPDGTRLAFRSNRKGAIEFYDRSAAGGGVDRRLLSLEAYRTDRLGQNLIPTDWSPDGRQIIFSAPTLESGNDLWLVPIGNEEKPTRFIASSAEQLHGNFSPDGRLVAYTSNESGKFEVYVETIPRSDRKWLVSTNGGYEPRWRADEREIYYLSDDRKLMAVAVGAGPSFAIPKLLFQTHVPAGVSPNRTHYVPSRDGQRFLVNSALDAPVSPITVVAIGRQD